MMSEKEHGILKGSTFPSLWEVVTSSSDATAKRVFFPIENEQSWSNMICTGIDTESPGPVKRRQGQRTAEYLLM
jgi:hypothetical protein